MGFATRPPAADLACLGAQQFGLEKTEELSAVETSLIVHSSLWYQGL